MKPRQNTSPERVPSRPNPAIGFTAIRNGSPENLSAVQEALGRALAHFPDLEQWTLKIGQTHLTLWGRGSLEQFSHTLPDGSTLALVGSPIGNFSWEFIQEKLAKATPNEPFCLPWEDRVILIQIDPGGNTWKLWNDWVGSIPVFHAQTGTGRIASTLEPVVVNAAGFTPEDVHLPSLIALFMWGHFFSDWTFYKNMKVVPPDGEATWDASGFHFTQYLTVKPSEERWEASWDELIEEMHVLTQKAILASLNQHPQWILPLSSGLDSRLIATVAAENNKTVFAYTWGSARTTELVHARKIARRLGIPWKGMNPGSNYLSTYKQLWINLFGSAMHFHGMYQMPFLDALKTEPAGPIVSGFIGECLAGYDVKFLSDTHKGKRPYQIVPDDYLIWKVSELGPLMSYPIQEALDELAAEVDRLLASIPGALWQRLRYLIIWGRQRFFTYFQPVLSSYWRGVSTPYLDREYARFAFSLPRAVMDQRILQQAMLRRYYPKIAVIPGTYAPEPALLSGRYLLKKRIAQRLPESTVKTILPDIFRIRSRSDIDCVKALGTKAFGSLFDQLDFLRSWISTKNIESTYQSIVKRDEMNSVAKLQCIETFAYRISNQVKL